ncbi:pentatricopeptide repeat-containing protein At5g15280, mitochondrial [Coffea eugenioides]|uniref:pentatricopeptide repeat-containing protein At5g15280, mitochondrial n=1 Tax=Coffea eugenioides TaxID=49369 RepID=UPI000F608F3E|nr:pentatricopeptide repeat-containing protein At5g15280, mitochondrial [Coffea eugenioides]
MLQTLFSSQLNKPPAKQVRLQSLSQVSVFCYFTTCVESPELSLSPSLIQTNESHEGLPSINFRSIARSVISKSTNIWDSNKNKGEPSVNLSLKDYFLRLSSISPESIRRFWRVSALRPQDVLDILLGFESDSGIFDIEHKKIESLWGVYKWAGEQTSDFQHLPQSCKIMAKMLVRVGLFSEAECLLSRLDSEAIFLGYHEIFSHLIEGYLADCDLERALLNYDRMRRLGLSPSFSCYRSLLDSLVQINETHLAYEAYVDMIKVWMERSAGEKRICENVARLLCIEGRVQEARNLVKSILAFGIEPTNAVLDAIVNGYCEKKDYEDILSFLIETRGVPDVAVGNKVICSLSRSFGAERANEFMQELEQLGFSPNEITFGILIGQTSFEGSVKNAFIFLSEMLSRNLKPDVNTCNALMSALFMEGLWKQSLDVLVEMNDWGVMPKLSTFRVLLSGLLKARQFGQVKAIVGEMAGRGLIRLSLPEDHLSMALTSLGINSLAIKVRRDNDMQFSKTEFFDDLGNGLYLETDLHEFDKIMVNVLHDAMIPDFNSLVLKNCMDGDIKVAVKMVDEMSQWGQVLSTSSASILIKRLSGSHINIKTINSVLEKLPYLIYQLDQGALNKLVQKYSRRGCTCRAKLIFDNMIRMKLEIENETYSALLISLCKRANLRSFQLCWEVAHNSIWLPALKDGKDLLNCLCQPKLLKEAVELLEAILMGFRCKPLDACNALIEKLCCRGFTNIADVLAKELLERGLVLDDVVYNHLLSGFCREKRLAEASLLVDAMVAKKFDPCLDVSLQLIPQVCKAGNLEKAVLLKDICIKKQSSAQLSVYHALINGLCKVGRLVEAFHLLEEMSLKRQLLDKEVYNMLLQGYYQVNDLKKVGELLGVMIRKKVGMSTSTYCNLVQLACAAGKFSSALSLKELLLKENSLSQIATYNILLFHLSLVQNTTRVVDTIVDGIQSKGLQFDAVTYNSIVKGASYNNDVPRSLRYLETMITQGFRPSNRALRNVMCILCYLGELGKALQLSQEMELRGWIHGSVIQLNIVEAFLRTGNLREAVKFLDRMALKGLIPKSIIYDYIIKRLCQHGELEKASDLLNIMIKNGSILDSTSFDYLVLGCCVNHKLDTALDYHSEMLCRNLIPSSKTWNALVSSFSEAGRVVEAERLLHVMVQRGETPSREMYSAVINKYRSENNLGKASQLLKAMQQCGQEPDFETHWSLISNFSSSVNKDDSTKSGGFLSKLLSGIGFPRKD